MSSSEEYDDNDEVNSDDLGSDISREVLDYVSDTPLAIEDPPMASPKKEFPGVILIANIPCVEPGEKMEKLLSIISRLTDARISQDGKKAKKDMPINPKTGSTYGFMIVEYEQEKDAEQTRLALEGFKLDKGHIFRCIKFDQRRALLDTPKEFVQSSRLTRKYLSNWIATGNGREQLFLRYQNETEIYFHDHMQGSLELVYGGSREKAGGKLWCDSKVQWSPHGSYLMTFHKQGIALWGNDDFQKQARFSHPMCKDAMFSPDEKYLMTWNGSHPSERDYKAVRFFNVITGQEIRSFETPTCNPTDKEFPQFLWNHTGEYIAKCSDKDISVFTMPGMQRLKDEKGKPAQITFDGITSFAWSPKDDILAVWVKERDNVPARLTLLEIPSRKELASRSRTQCGAYMIWQSLGDYLCLIISKLSKTTKKESKKKGASVEIFRLREHNVPVESLELKDLVKGFFWETRGHRFALITEPEIGNPHLSFYSLADNRCVLVQDIELPSAAYNIVYWAPEGQYFIVAAIPGGDLLWGVLTQDNRLEILYKDEHFMLNHVAWDPSSRYVITGVAQPMQQIGGGNIKYQMESGFCIWTFQGRLLYRQQKEKLYDMQWRPHPKSLLSKDEADGIRKNLRDYSKRYDADDEQGKEAVRAHIKKFREEKIAAFSAVLTRIRKAFHQETEAWAPGLCSLENAAPWEYVTEQEEVIIDEKMDLIST